MEEIRNDGTAVRLSSFIRLDSEAPPFSSGGSRRRAAPPVSQKSPSRMPLKPSKRKTEREEPPVYVESCLLQLCRGGKWSEVIERCQRHPEEASLVPLGSNDQRVNGTFNAPSSEHGSVGQDYTPVFRETPLGVVLGSMDLRKDEALPLIQALIKANPRQISASQLVPGHTALREAILNKACSEKVLRVLVEATSTYSDGILAFRYKDQGGLTLIDHLVTAVQLETSAHSMEMLKCFVETQPIRHRQSQTDVCSPLILLLTLGTSSEGESPTSETAEAHEGANSRLEYVLNVTKILLDDDPSLLFQNSRVSQCSPLHVALRNYGTYEPLITELIVRDTTRKLFKHRNLYGDLPLHVACSVGVPLSVLKHVLKETVAVSNTDECGERPDTNPLIWSTNTSGYTPIDLEWVRHIESGNGFYTARTFYPLEVAGVKRHCSKQDQYYKELLREAVDKVIKGDAENVSEEAASEEEEDDARLTFGYLIDRIALLIRSASITGNSPSIDAELSRETTLLDACSLCSPYSPTLPLPLLELYLWLRSNDVLTSDSKGLIPLHRAISVAAKRKIGPMAHAASDWGSFVCQLVDASAESCRVETSKGQLPLHLILDFDGDDTFAASSEEMPQARQTIVEKLISVHPESVDKPDPSTGLYPFMMAAKDRSLFIDTVFCLLRHTPSRCDPHPTRPRDEDL